ncbi:response regulator [Desulfurispirillum indicum]|uniref:Response regulator receiver n=1 Tax=Desulfurispirillum indicum (strain ATCC BAA-1389 / DSM 22839 / S5) TaxID=653733 RepID=E6W0V6_DESIS|nr:response regulator [Desulfurispirillum indicum]ADU66451.1 response regulator receiver [Desulfurispirillum indicum S5]UCZ55788.1 response regulator [Desulfurispirillum indicum]
MSVLDDSFKDKTVLIVEDDSMARLGLQRLLRFRFQDIHLAVHGRDGLEKVAQFHPDVVLTDLEMPVMSGSDMLRQLKSNSPELPVIVITAFADDASHVPEADAVLTKPILKAELLQALRKCLR